MMLRGVGRVFALRILVDNDLERVIRLAQRLRIALAHVLAGEAAEETEVVVEVDHALQIIRIRDIRMIRMQANKTVDGLIRRGGFAVLPVAVRDVDLRLLREVAERVAAFERLEILAHLPQSLPDSASWASVYNLLLFHVAVSSVFGQAVAGRDDGDARGQRQILDRSLHRSMNGVEGSHQCLHFLG